ncbi:MAG TPA: DEAD/DEAH box helicase [Bdellovibrionota bacterium]|nr:DEAD/DEAH box helicase [Bdellovibrionota bacterium]
MVHTLFKDYSLPAPILESLNQMGFENPTEIQAQAIPVALAGKDIIGAAQTGTGKTAAFLIPMLSQLMSKPQNLGLVLVPTRELADQVFGVAKDLMTFDKDFSLVMLIGGVPMGRQIRMISTKRPRLLIATPGRLIDLLRQRAIKLTNVSHLVVDEADRMLDMGFEPQLNQVLSYLPAQRQTMMFTATLADNVQKLSSKYLSNPQIIRIQNSTEFKKSIEQRSVSVDAANKVTVLMEEVRKSDSTVLIFARTQRGTDKLTRIMRNEGLSVTQIHGGRTQGQRLHAISGFKKGTYKILVATDIAARGIDIDHVGLVINYDVPECPDDYIHRIGRTGRADRTGVALTLLSPADAGLWWQIQKKNGVAVGPRPPETGEPRRRGGRQGGGNGGGGGGNRRFGDGGAGGKGRRFARGGHGGGHSRVHGARRDNAGDFKQG